MRFGSNSVRILTPIPISFSTIWRASILNSSPWWTASVLLEVLPELDSPRQLEALQFALNQLEGAARLDSIGRWLENPALDGLRDINGVTMTLRAFLLRESFVALAPPSRPFFKPAIGQRLTSDKPGEADAARAVLDAWK